MASKNFWRETAHNAIKSSNSPELRKKSIDQKYTSSLLWMVGSIVIIFLYVIAVYYGYSILDNSSILIIIIVGAFAIYSSYHLKEVTKERDEIYSHLPLHLRKKSFLFKIWK